MDVDTVSDGKDIVVAGIVEHIERAGIHSGDSCFMMPTQTLSKEQLLEVEKQSKLLASACKVVGLMNVQYAVTNDKIYVLEVNPRASRSVPFISKVTGIPWAKVAARVMVGESLKEIDSLKKYGNILRHSNYLEAISSINYVAVKESVFPFSKFKGVDTVLGPEMKSTGEVMGIDYTAAGGYYRAQIAAGMALPNGGAIFISVCDADKEYLLPIAKKIAEMKFQLIATVGTAKFLSDHGISVEVVNKVRDGSPHVVDLLLANKINMVINTPEGSRTLLDSKTIRSTSTELKIPLFTTIAAAEAAINAIEQLKSGNKLEARCLQEYLYLSR